MIKYLIAGATDAIGSALLRQLAAGGKGVRAFVRDAEKFHRLLPDLSAEVVGALKFQRKESRLGD